MERRSMSFLWMLLHSNRCYKTWRQPPPNDRLLSLMHAAQLVASVNRAPACSCSAVLTSKQSDWSAPNAFLIRNQRAAEKKALTVLLLSFETLRVIENKTP